MFDVLIRNGRVVDGTGNPWFPADIGIRDGTIAAIGRIPDDAPGETVIDAAGKIVAPGFIDIHSHSDFVVADGSHGEVLAPFAAQGITTLVTGNCGYSPAPVNPRTRAELASYTTFLRAGDLPDAWTGFGDYLDYLDGHGLMFNVVPMVAHGALRIHEVGFEGRELTPEERTRMRDQLRKAMEEGAWGLSSGLLYAPGIFAPPEEIEDLASELGPLRRAVCEPHPRLQRDAPAGHQGGHPGRRGQRDLEPALPHGGVRSPELVEARCDHRAP